MDGRRRKRTVESEEQQPGGGEGRERLRESWRRADRGGVGEREEDGEGQ